MISRRRLISSYRLESGWRARALRFRRAGHEGRGAVGLLFLDEDFRILPAGDGPADEEQGHDGRPENVHPQEQKDAGHHHTPDESDDTGDLEAADLAHSKPKQRPQNLAAIERVNGKDVENE